MHTQTHILSGWCVANCLPLTPRQRLLAMLAATLPDLDGLGILFGEDYFVRFHHVVGHNLFALAAISAVLAAFSRRFWTSLALFLALGHLHLLMDYYGSGFGWTIAYFWPVSSREFQTVDAWKFYSWQNLTAFGVLLLWTILIAIRSKRTPLEALMPRLDRQLVALLAGRNPAV
jgi:inner membrane protein